MGKIINFLEAKQALELAGVKRMYMREREAASRPSWPQKKALIVSALPGEALPSEYPDFRPYLQRDGLILLSWARWDKYYNDAMVYRIHWMKSCGKNRLYCSGFVDGVSDIKEMNKVMPSQYRDFEYRKGIIGRSPMHQDLKSIADIVFLAAPDLNCASRPLFVQKLKAAGITVDFDYEFSLGKAKELEFKKQLAEIEALKLEGAQSV